MLLFRRDNLRLNAADRASKFDAFFQAYFSTHRKVAVQSSSTDSAIELMTIRCCDITARWWYIKVMNSLLSHVFVYVDVELLPDTFHRTPAGMLFFPSWPHTSPSVWSGISTVQSLPALLCPYLLRWKTAGCLLDFPVSLRLWKTPWPDRPHLQLYTLRRLDGNNDKTQTDLLLSRPFDPRFST